MRFSVDDVLTIREACSLPYFKVWANGKRLLKYVEAEGAAVADREDPYRAGSQLVVEGFVQLGGQGFMVCSDRLDSGCASNKHHVLLAEAEAKKLFSEITRRMHHE